MANLYSRYCELPPTDDPRAFIAAVIGIAERYPIAAVLAAFDPVDGLPTRKQRPALVDIKAALVGAYEPVAMLLERERIATERRSYVPPRPASAEEKAHVQKKFEELKRRLAAATASPADMPNNDGYAARALADLAARQAQEGPADLVTQQRRETG